MINSNNNPVPGLAANTAVHGLYPELIKRRHKGQAGLGCLKGRAAVKSRRRSCYVKDTNKCAADASRGRYNSV
jgi:hypothetical protein